MQNEKSKSEKKEKIKKTLARRIRKISLWFLASVFVLIAAVILFLSVLFPSDYVKKILVENLQAQLHRPVYLNKLDFNVFSGIKISGFEIKERALFDSKKTFVRIKSLNVDYSLISLIFGNFVLKEATLKGLEVYVVSKKINGKVRYNFDDLAQIPKSSAKQELKEEKPLNAPPKVAKPSFPIAFSIGKVGLEDAKLQLTDYTNPILPVQVTADKLTALVENLSSGNNPFNIKGGIQFSFSEIKQGKAVRKNFNLYVGMNGKIKPFGKKGYLNPTADLALEVKNFLMEGSFLQTAINNGLKLALEEAVKQIDKQLPAIKEQAKKAVAPIVDKQLKNIESKIDELRKNQKLSKKDLEKEKKKQVEAFAKKLDPALNSAMKPILSSVGKLPKAVRSKARKEVLKQKDKIKEQAKKSFDKQLTKIINKADKAFNNQIAQMKKAAKGQINKLLDKAINKASKKLKDWANSLKKSGIGLGFLKGGVNFKGGSIGFKLVNWKALLDLNLMSSKNGIKGKADYGIFSSKGSLDSVVYLDPAVDKIGILSVFKKEDKLAVPIKMTFNQNTGEYKLNGSVLSNEKVKSYALKFLSDYIKTQLGVGTDSKNSASKADTSKYKNLMQAAKDGNIKKAVSESSKIAKTLEKYKKAAKTTKKLKKGLKKLKKLF